MRVATLALVAVAGLAGFAAQARRTPASSKSKTVGLGRSCKKSSDCRSKAQRCLKESDMNGKALDRGFCALPCLSIESGTTKVVPGAPVPPASAVTPKDLKSRKAPPRCPPRYLCRSADQSSPIDMCVKE